MKYDFKYHSNARAFDPGFGRVINATDGGFERGYAQGYGEGEKTAKAAAEAANAVILADCNAVLPTKGASTAETLGQVPNRIGEIKSYADGYDVGVEDGKKAEYDAFWDSFQQNGTRTDYDSGRGFYGAWWTDENFKPKYDIAPVGNCSQLFSYSGITDVKGICERQGITLDLSRVTYSSNFLNNAKVTRMPVCDFSNIPNIATVFNSAKELVWVDAIVLNENGTQTFGSGAGYNWVLYADKIEHCPIEGKIGTNVWFNSLGKLDDETVQSIIDALVDLSGKTAQSVTFHKTVGNKLTEAQKATITAKNWTLVY